MSCALSESRVLIGSGSHLVNSSYMESFRVENGPCISSGDLIDVSEPYYCFSATSGNDTRVAMSYPNSDQSVRVHRLLGDRLEEVARIQLKWPLRLLWLADCLLVTDSHVVLELKLSDTQLECRRELITASENIDAWILCAVNDKLAIFEYKSHLLIREFPKMENLLVHLPHNSID